VCNAGKKYISAETTEKLVAKIEAGVVDSQEEVQVFHFDNQ
jgi:hypothetical protein